MYKSLYSLKKKKRMSLLCLKPWNLVPLLGGNYRFFIYISRGILLSFSFTVTFSPMGTLLETFYLVFAMVFSLSFRSLFYRRQGWPSLGTFFKMSTSCWWILVLSCFQLQFLLWLGVSLCVTAGGPRHLLMNDGWDQEEQPFPNIINCEIFASSKF